MKRCGLYIRVSSDEQARDPEGSLKSQAQRLREELAEKTQQGDSWVEHRFYEDRARSGKDTNRPAFQAMWRDVEQGQLDIVVCTELSRVSRSVMDFLHFVQFLKDHRVEFLALKQRFDTTTPYGKVLITICIALAEFERELTSERTRENMVARARRGLWNGAILFGYDLDPKRKGYPLPNVTEAAIVNVAFDLYLEYGSLKRVAQELNRRGYRRRAFKSRRGREHRDRRFSEQGIQYLLTNVAYLGLKEVNKQYRSHPQDTLPEKEQYHIVPAVWPAIVERATFDHVQALLAKNCHTKHNVAVQGQHVFILSGLLRCDVCHLSLEGASGTSQRGDLHHYYRHPHRQRHAECRLPSLPADALEALVLNRLNHLGEDEVLLQDIADAAVTRAASDLPQVQLLLTACQEELMQLETEAEQWLRKSLDFTRQQIEEFIQPKLVAISDRKQSLKAEVGRLQTTLDRLPDSTVILSDLKSALQSFATLAGELPPYKRKEMLGCLVKSVTMFAHQMDIAFWRTNAGAEAHEGELGVDRVPIILKRVAHGKLVIRAINSAEAQVPPSN